MLMRSPEVWEHPGVPLPQENTLGQNLPYNKTHRHNIRRMWFKKSNQFLKSELKTNRKLFPDHLSSILRSVKVGGVFFPPQVYEVCGLAKGLSQNWLLRRQENNGNN
jgi:hypothetical protein